MRKRFDSQTELGQTPIERVKLPAKSRDELPPILAGLQWVFKTPEINEEVFALLEQKIISGKQDTGRPGMDLWHILVLGVVRLGLDCDYDRIEHIANYDGLVRKIMGLPDFGIEGQIQFHHKTISDNICHIDASLLEEINVIVAREGLNILKKNGAQNLELKIDSYVLESNVHYPTDTSLLWDAGRKSINLISALFESLGLGGWRKATYLKKELKRAWRISGKSMRGGGIGKEERVTKAVSDYLDMANQIEQKVRQSLAELKGHDLSISNWARLERASYFHGHLVKHIDLVDRRLLKGESIAHEEKVFSLFEPHTEMIVKGKAGKPMELGHRLLIGSEKHGLILDYKVMEGGSESGETIPLVDRMFNNFGQDCLQSLSTDKGFSSVKDRELLELFIEQVVMPKKGKRSVADLEREHGKKWGKLRYSHSAVESDINCLEHHGLNRCPDKGLSGYKRYVGLGILAYNLHKIGARLLENEKRQQEGLRMRRRAS